MDKAWSSALAKGKQFLTKSVCSLTPKYTFYVTYILVYHSKERLTVTSYFWLSHLCLFSTAFSESWAQLFWKPKAALADFYFTTHFPLVRFLTFPIHITSNLVSSFTPQQKIAQLQNSMITLFFLSCRLTLSLLLYWVSQHKSFLSSWATSYIEEYIAVLLASQGTHRYTRGSLIEHNPTWTLPCFTMLCQCSCLLIHHFNLSFLPTPPAAKVPQPVFLYPCTSTKATRGWRWWSCVFYHKVEMQRNYQDSSNLCSPFPNRPT